MQKKARRPGPLTEPGVTCIRRHWGNAGNRALGHKLASGAKPKSRRCPIRLPRMPIQIVDIGLRFLDQLVGGGHLCLRGAGCALEVRRRRHVDWTKHCGRRSSVGLCISASRRYVLYLFVSALRVNRPQGKTSRDPDECNLREMRAVGMKRSGLEAGRTEKCATSITARQHAMR